MQAANDLNDKVFFGYLACIAGLSAIYYYQLDLLHAILELQIVLLALFIRHSRHMASPSAILNELPSLHGKPSSAESLQEFEGGQYGIDDNINELHHGLLITVPHMVTEFMELYYRTARSKTSGLGQQDDWILMANCVESPPFTTVHRSPDSDHKYRVAGILDNSAETVFDFLTDVEARPSWDELMEEATILAQLDSVTRVVYIKLKGIWPTSSRDMIILSHIHKIPLKDLRDQVPDDFSISNDFTEDGPHVELFAYVNVTRTIEHFPGAPTPEEKGTIRMASPLSGQIIKPISQVTRNSQCEIMQLADGDPRGWIPSAVISFVMTQAIPRSMVKLNGLVSKLPSKGESEYFPFYSDKPEIDLTKIPVTIGMIWRSNDSSACSNQTSKVDSGKSTPTRTISQLSSMSCTSVNLKKSPSEFIQPGMHSATPWMVAAILGITVIRAWSK